MPVENPAALLHQAKEVLDAVRLCQPREPAHVGLQHHAINFVLHQLGSSACIAFRRRQCLDAQHVLMCTCCCSCFHDVVMRWQHESRQHCCNRGFWLCSQVCIIDCDVRNGHRPALGIQRVPRCLAVFRRAQHLQNGVRNEQIATFSSIFAKLRGHIYRVAKVVARHQEQVSVLDPD